MRACRRAAAAHLEPRRLDLDRAEQGVHSARAPVLGRLKYPMLQGDPVVGRILRNLAAQHARLQLGQQRLALGEHQADLREQGAADHRRPADRHQLRRLHLARSCPRLQPHRSLHHARRLRGQASSRPISPRRATLLPPHASPHFASATYRERGLCERFEVYEKTHTSSSDDRSVMSG